MATDLAAKLQLRNVPRLELINAPIGYCERLTVALEGIEVDDGEMEAGSPGAVLAFVTLKAEAVEVATRAFGRVAPGGLAWIAYPKGGARAGTDVNRDILWDTLTPTGWRPVRQVAIDDVWSAIRFRPERDVGR